MIWPNTRSLELSSGTSLFFFCFWTWFPFIFILKLSVLLTQFFPLFFPAFTISNHTSGISECWQSGREVLAPQTVCVCQPCRENRHISDASRETHFLQSSSTLLSNCCSAALMPLLAHCYSSPSLLLLLWSLLCHPRLRKWKSLFLMGRHRLVTGCFPAFCLVHAGIGVIFSLIILTFWTSLFIDYFFLLTPHCCVWLSGYTAYIVFYIWNKQQK